MNKQLILGLSGLVLVLLLFFFGKTVEKKPFEKNTLSAVSAAKNFDIDNYISKSKQNITPNQSLFLSKLENSVKRGDVAAQQITANNQLAAFWKDSIKQFEPYAFYLSEAAKLDNSEKNLTFAAQLILDNLKGEQDEAKLNWETDRAISLFEQALKLNPESDDLKIGLGSCYIYGKGRSSGNPQDMMQGIQQVLAVVRKDSTNMKAQLVLGVGGFVSGQYDKAIARLKKVVEAEPNNTEAIAFLADANANKGDKTEAIKWYQALKKIAHNKDYEQEIDARIKQLK